jgi:hypothetical protein
MPAKQKIKAAPASRRAVARSWQLALDPSEHLSATSLLLDVLVPNYESERRPLRHAEEEEAMCLQQKMLKDIYCAIFSLWLGKSSAHPFWLGMA